MKWLRTPFLKPASFMDNQSHPLYETLGALAAPSVKRLLKLQKANFLSVGSIESYIILSSDL